MSRLLLLATVLTAGIFLTPGSALGRDVRLTQVFPQLAGKNQVRWYRFDWKELEFHPAATGAAVRLYYYDANTARHARARIENGYRDLARTFDYFPKTTIPFLLYNSHFEFESTQAFFVSEGVLGVTSVEDLRMAVPYWGEHQRFDEVMRHEMVHQFSIQKIVERGRHEGCNPLTEIPLWFIEGIAQLYSHDGLTTEARGEVIARARAKRKAERLPAFFADEPMTFERIYLIGHAQAVFLEAEFGAGTVMRIVDRTGKLCSRRSFFGSLDEDELPFARLVAEVTGARPKALNEKWRAWVRDQAEPARTARTPAAAMQALTEHGRGEIDSFSLSSDGKTLFYRALETENGESRLYLQSVANPRVRVTVTSDRRLGLVSLHPIDRRVTAIGRGLIVYVGRTGKSDEIFVARYRHSMRNGKEHIDVDDPVRHPMTSYPGLLEAGFPAIDPVSGRVAFVGLDRRTGYLDVYALTRPLDERSPLEKLTDDPYAEQGLAYGPSGELYTASDSTADGRYAVTRVSAGKKEPLERPAGAADALAPAVDAQGRVIFQSGASGLEQGYRAECGDGAVAAGAPLGRVGEIGGNCALVQLTETPTGLLEPAPDGAGGLYAIAQIRGKRTLVHIREAKLLAEPVTATAPGAPAELPVANLGGARDYDPYDRRNYALIGAQAAAASGPFAIGQVVFSDTFRNHVVALTAYYSGDADIGEFEAAYIDRSRRVGYGGSIFLENGLQIETPVSTLADSYLLRRFGAAFQVEMPLSPFFRFTGAVAPEQLRSYRFSEPSGAFAREHRLSTFATEARAGAAFDTLGHTLWGPSRGQSFVLDARGTLTFGPVDPFGDVTADYQYFYSPVRGLDGLTATLRAAGGTSVGGRFREQYFLPAAYNYRVVREGSIDLFGEHYTVAQAALLFPLSPVLARAFFFQGVLGADAGAVAFEPNRLWRGRRAAGVTGVNVGVGPIVVRLHVSRPFAVGGDRPAKNVWNSYFSILLSPLLFAYSLQ